MNRLDGILLRANFLAAVATTAGVASGHDPVALAAVASMVTVDGLWLAILADRTQARREKMHAARAKQRRAKNERIKRGVGVR